MKTANYERPIPDYGDLMPVAEFREYCAEGWFNDNDGHGAAVKDGLMVRGLDHCIYPSDVDSIPLDEPRRGRPYLFARRDGRRSDRLPTRRQRWETMKSRARF